MFGEHIMYEDDIEIKNAKEALEYVTKSGRMLKHVPVELITPELVALCLEHGKTDGESLIVVLQYAPKELIPQNIVGMCVEAVRKDRANAKLKSFDGFAEGGIPPNDLVENALSIPVEFWTAELSEICLAVLGERGEYLKYIPNERKTAAMCAVAVKNSYAAIKHIPDSLKTAEMCLDAVNAAAGRQDLFEILAFVPKACMSAGVESVCLERMKKDASKFKKIPEELRTAELCLQAVTMDGYLLEHVPDALKTPEVYLEAVKRNIKMFEKIPDDRKTSRICFEAVRQNAWLLKDGMPDTLKTEEMCLEAVKVCGELLEYTPVNFRTAAVCLEAVKQDGRAFDFVPENIRTAELLETAKSKGYIQKVAAEEINTMDKFQNVLNDQTKYMPPEVRAQIEAMMKPKQAADDSVVNSLVDQFVAKGYVPVVAKTVVERMLASGLTPEQVAASAAAMGSAG